MSGKLQITKIVNIIFTYIESRANYRSGIKNKAFPMARAKQARAKGKSRPLGIKECLSPKRNRPKPKSNGNKKIDFAQIERGNFS